MAYPQAKRRAVTRPLDRQTPSGRGKSTKAPEGMLLLVLLISVLLVVASLVMARGPAAGVFNPIAESSN